jgi:hypothetical protein
MPTSLKTGRHHFYRPTHAQSSKGEWFTATGLDRPQRWNGETASTQDVGITAPSTAVTLASAGGAGALTGDYNAYVRFVDSDGIPSALSPISNTLTLASANQINYSSVPVSPESRVAKREIFRNTDGQEDTYYLDVTINDNSTTTATSTRTDAQLEAQDELPLLDDDGDPYADRFGVPPQNKRVIVNTHNRFFYGVDALYDEGCVVLVNGSALVTGINTKWTQAMVGREFMRPGDSAAYAITAVGSSTTLTLGSNYAGTSSNFANYAIQAGPAERNLWYFSSLGEPESVHANDSFRILFDGDLDTAGFSLAYSMFIARSNSIHRISFASDPTRDLNSTKVSHRGVINPHCWVPVENVIFALDAKGVHVFDGNGSRGISDSIQDLFGRDKPVPGVGTPYSGASEYRLNWSDTKFWFASHDQVEEVVRFHVNLSDAGYPKEALCYSYKQQAWWIEVYPFRHGHSVEFYSRGQSSHIIGGEFGANYFRLGTSDLHNGGGAVVGTATSATLYSLTDSRADLHASCVNAPLYIYDGKGQGQLRRITSVSSGEMTIKTPWTVLPDSTSKYLVGPVGWRLRTRTFRTFQRDGVDEVRRIKVMTKPTEVAHVIRCRMYRDQLLEADKQAMDFARSGGRSEYDTYDVEWDIERKPASDDPDTGEFSGWRDWDFAEGMEAEAYGDRYVNFEMHGGAVEGLTIHHIDLEGVSPGDGG